MSVFQMKKVRPYSSDLPGITLWLLDSRPCALSMYCVNSKYFQMYVLGAISGLSGLGVPSVR